MDINHVRCGVSSKCATGMHTASDEQGATLDSLPSTCVAHTAAEMKRHRKKVARTVNPDGQSGELTKALGDVCSTPKSERPEPSTELDMQIGDPNWWLW